MARIEPVIWQPPSLPYYVKSGPGAAVWVADLEDGTPEEVELRSPRLRQAGYDTGVPFDELAMRDLRPEVVRVRLRLQYRSL